MKKMKEKTVIFVKFKSICNTNHTFKNKEKKISKKFKNCNEKIAKQKF